MSIISFKDVHYTYPGEDTETLCGIDLEIEKGSFTAVLGRNGSGKSTLARHMNGILVPDSGTVSINGILSSDEDRLIEIRSLVGMVFQNPDNQIVANVVEEDVAFAPENLGVAPEEIRRRVDKALKTVGMYDFRLHAPHLLSGGQKQRVAIAGVLAMHPEIIVLDEPTAMLDPIGRREVISTVTRLCRENGLTVVLITHHMDECIGADRLLVMSRGSIIADGAPGDVFSDVEMMEREGLTVPESVRLMHDLNRLGLSFPQNIITDDECAALIAEKINDIRLCKPTEGIYNKHNIKNTELCKHDEKGCLKVESVSHTFGTGTPFEKTAISDISLTIGKGELVGIIGHTGSGKSTFIQHLNALYQPTSGRVLMDDADINESKISRRDIRRRVGMVFQYPEYQLFEETVFADIAFGPRNMGLDDEEIKIRVSEAAEFSGVPAEHMERSPLELSGGQKRRIAIAGVIAMRPDVLVLDEPTAGLDPEGCAMILGNILEYRRRTGSTVIIISHNMDDMANFMDRLIVFSKGHILMDGTPEEIFSRGDELTSTGLSLPHATMLAESFRKAGADVGTSIYTHEGLLSAILRKEVRSC